MPTTLLSRLSLFTGIALIFAYLLQHQLDGAVELPAQLMNLALWLSFCAVAPLLDKVAKNAREEAYLYYLGVSGLRMMVYMVGIGLAVFAMPGMRNRAMVLLVTGAFLCYTVVEVTALVRKLREIFKSNP